MRSTCRLFMAALFFVVAAGSAAAQSNEPPPAPEPPVEQPASEVPVIVPEQIELPPAPPAEPAVEPSTPVPEEVPPPVVEPPPAPAPKKRVARRSETTTTKKAKPAEPAPSPENEVANEAAEAAAATAAVDTGSVPPPPGAVPGTVPPETAMDPQPSAPSAETVAAGSSVEETETQERSGVGGWILGALAVLGLIGIIFLIKRRTIQDDRLSILDRETMSSRSPLTHGP